VGFLSYDAAARLVRVDQQTLFEDVVQDLRVQVRQGALMPEDFAASDTTDGGPRENLIRPSGTVVQVLGMVGVESLVLTATGVFFGTAAGLAGIIPFTVVRTDGDLVLPDQGLGTWLAIVAIATAATVVTSLATARRTLRTPAVGAVTLVA
jgi:hypothetical protein